ncbi:hypothetical protein PCANC_09292 [Puccinia coronata f. sp. avenae]|uniref:GPI ethanolamine phosphate transferase 2 n=1 Tax=Puccinia coronata f. sp. avenae TaxID=200324 RepID=A0A2N5T5K1_9BASI|nr:hypothetical protein PCASD_19364 [Puccinia coronata f. sp. avenae]PLW20781.1 hypothetical protein PCANC_09292 [Puccinia coronata f. sp. avenae]
MNFLLLLLVGLQLLGVALFLHGFFPKHTPPTGYGRPPRPAEPPPFHRLVFVVIDALRSDFMFDSNLSRMAFAQSLVRSGKALPYTAMAQAPTVTLPRLKALTTGSTPQFLDAVLNIHQAGDQAAILERTDSWLRQLIFSSEHQVEAATPGAHPARRKARFYGDDTWLRLFPASWFTEVDGVSSFYVSDTEIVDHNVTRHIPHVFSHHLAQDWDIIILHYLGLDHVGHLGGANSPLMGPKQEQLDRALERIFDNISQHDLQSKQNTLLLVTGDHGMTDAGNHGGSSPEELSTALLLASPCFNHAGLEPGEPILPEKIQQVDIVPTLGILFGTGIPPASIGVAIPSALELSCSGRPHHLLNTSSLACHSQMHAALRNHAVQLTRLLEPLLGGLAPAKAFLHLDDPTNENEPLETIISRLDAGRIRTILRTTQEYLLTRFSGSHLPTMVAGLIFLAAATGGFISAGFRDRRSPLSYQDILLVLLVLLHIASLGSTSFIEEEHDAWFFLGASSLLGLAFSAPPPKRYGYLVGAILVRILRGWSHNGQKASVDRSISTYLHGKPWLCHVVDPLGIYYLISTSGVGRGERLGGYRRVGMMLIAGAGMLSMTPMDRPLMYLGREFGVGLEAREVRPRAVYGLLGAGLALSAALDTRRLRDAARISMLVLLRSLTKVENYPVLWISLAAAHLSPLLLGPDHDQSVLATWLQLVFSKTTFFALGGSNSLATVDLSNAYNGLAAFTLPLVSFLTFLANFSGPLIVGMGAGGSSGLHRRKLVLRSSYFSLFFLVIAGLSTHFSTHLFVFSVFSPAVLCALVWLLGFHAALSLPELLGSWLFLGSSNA